MTLRLCFLQCDPLEAKPDGLLRSLVSESLGEPTTLVRRPSDADLVFMSDRLSASKRARRTGAYAARKASRRAGLNTSDPRVVFRAVPPTTKAPVVWYTQENSRPPVGDWAGFLTSDLDGLDGRNAYFPPWFFLLDLLGSSGLSHFLGRPLAADEVLSPRGADFSSRPGFVCAFINNPTEMRGHAIKALSQVGPVDVYGRSVGRPVASKLAVATGYKFVLCFENDLYPGYVTEKPFDAWATGAIPIWWGSDPAGYLNPGAMIDAARCASMSEMAELVAEVASHGGTWETIGSQPMLTRTPDLSKALSIVRAALT